MKIIIIGASGAIGKPVTRAFEQEHEVIKVGKSSGDFQVDISSAESIENLFKQVGPFDALVNVSGDAYFGPFESMTEKEFRIGVESKLMGQINLVLIGKNYINPKGSFTLTSGILTEQPVRLASNASAVNGAVEAFARAAAVELENGIRINVVSPDVVEDSPGYFPYFPGHQPVTMERVVYGYLRAVLGPGTGEVIKVS